MNWLDVPDLFTNDRVKAPKLVEIHCVEQIRDRGELRKGGQDCRGKMTSGSYPS